LQFPILFRIFEQEHRALPEVNGVQMVEHLRILVFGYQCTVDERVFEGRLLLDFKGNKAVVKHVELCVLLQDVDTAEDDVWCWVLVPAADGYRKLRHAIVDMLGKHGIIVEVG